MDSDKNISQAMEDYLRTIYKLEEQGERVTTSAIAERLSVAPASVTKMLKRLDTLKLIEYQPYHGVGLSSLGKKTALGIVRNHRLIELFLSEIVGVPWDRVHEEAHRLEHVLSDYLEERLVALLDDPSVDPHGQPIPTRDGQIEERDLLRLSDVPIGFVGVVAEIEDDDADLLRYVAERGLFPQTELEVLERDAFGGGVSVSIKGERFSFGPEATRQIWLFAQTR